MPSRGSRGPGRRLPETTQGTDGRKGAWRGRDRPFQAQEVEKVQRRQGAQAALTTHTAACEPSSPEPADATPAGAPHEPSRLSCLPGRANTEVSGGSRRGADTLTLNAGAGSARPAPP